MVLTIRNFPQKYAYIILTMILFTSGTVYSYIYGSLSDAIKIGITLLSVLVFFMHRNKMIRIESLFQIVLLCLIITIIGIINGSSVSGILVLEFRIIGIFLFVEYSYHMNVDIFDCLFKVIFVIAVVYLAFYLIFETGIIPFDQVRTRVVLGNEDRVANRSVIMYTNFYNIYYRWQSTRFFGVWMARNNGPFWEPGNYQIYLNFALTYYLFHDNNKKNVWIILLLSSAVINTTSTMGIIIFCINIILYIIKSRKSLSKLVISAIVIISILILGIHVYVEKIETQSYAMRASDSIHIKELFQGNFFVGNGYNSGFIKYNSWFILLADFGIIGGVLFISYLIYLFKISMKDSLITALAYMVWLVLSYTGQPIIYTNTSVLIMCVITQRYFVNYSSDGNDGNVINDMNIRWVKHIRKNNQ